MAAGMPLNMRNSLADNLSSFNPLITSFAAFQRFFERNCKLQQLLLFRRLLVVAVSTSSYESAESRLDSMAVGAQVNGSRQQTPTATGKDHSR